MAVKEVQSSSYEVSSSSTPPGNTPGTPQYQARFPAQAPPPAAPLGNSHGVPQYRGNLRVQPDPYGQYNQAHAGGPNQESWRPPHFLRGYLHMFDEHTVMKWESPMFYRKPGYAYEKLGQYRHADVFDRVYTGDYDDRYISPFDGKISKLVVQAVDDIYDNPANSTWRRTFIRNVTPFYLRLASWPTNHVDWSRGASREDIPMICIKWVLACLFNVIALGSPFAAEGASRNGGNYDPFPYRYLGYPKVSRNVFELQITRGLHPSEANPVQERLLMPRFLCFLQAEGQPAKLLAVDDWIAQCKDHTPISYVFVAYTAEQFRTPEDIPALLHIADAAARNAGVQAYWIGCSCMDTSNLQEDVYRICDVIRGAHSLAIAVGEPLNRVQGVSTDDLLQQWGSRMWTFPEVLLAPAGKEIKVYTRNTDLLRPMTVAKNQFAAKAWKHDAHVARQLIDHYEGNLILEPLELMVLALECLHKRERGKYLPGDHSYALMGLVRIRPKIDPSDSPFQAFARLSLANGSDQLLERLICVMPKNPDQPWHSMDDAYGTKLWEILPQDRSIAGIGDDDTIILDGCHAANVRWKSFTPVAYTRKWSFKRWVLSFFLRFSGIFFMTGAGMMGGQGAVRDTGAAIFALGFIFLALSPWLTRIVYLGKFWGTQCWYFGFEGYMDIESIERQLFGANLGRMKWTPYASPLSRHHRNKHGECVPDDPTTDEAVKAMVERAKHAQPGDQRIFTLVDTGSMTATLFQAARPPVCFILAGAEGGMQRAIGCSYDWTTGTLYRETVLRLETTVQDSMKRVPRVKIGFRRQQHRFRSFQEVGEATGTLRQGGKEE